MAVRGDLGGEESVSVPPAPPLILASTSPQRRAILTQLEIPFEVVAPEYDELPGTGPLERAAGKARSVSVTPDERPVLGVDTEVIFDGELLGKPANETEAEAMLEMLAGTTHAVVSGLCLRTQAWEELHEETTLVAFRSLAPRELAHYVASHEWEGRAGGYAIQGLGASLVERIECDFLNVVGLPGSLLVRVLASRFAGVYGFG
jgi:septum formation protein